MHDIDRRTAVKYLAGSLALGAMTGSSTSAFAEAPSAAAPRVFGPRAMPADRRLAPPKDLDGYFPFTPAKTPEEWAGRAEEVRRRVLLACGLWPKPEPADVEATLGTTVERDEYTVTPVSFESTPGLFVTGSLYRPKGAGGAKKQPGILCPHGHWSNGRFHDHGDAGIKRELDSGAESDPIGGRHPLQARCVQLARMGCVVFHYDMLGYADSAPIGFQLAHRFDTQRPEMSSPDRWGLFSAQSELRLLNIFGLQTLNSLRALDWLAALPDVDEDRLGVTGASGGGTQTMILAAIDDRIDAAFPAVMVSTAMQGGCTCENATYLRIDTGNVEFAALTAPRPLGLSAANDWTKEMPTKGIPELRRHYAMLGVPDRFRGEHFDFGHNFNAVSRAYMYQFFKDAFDLDAPIAESKYEPLTADEMTVWTETHPRPVPVNDAAKIDEAERRIVSSLAESQDRAFAALVPSDAKSLEEYRRVIGGAFATMVGRDLPAKGVVKYDKVKDTPGEGYLHYTATLTLERYGEQLPAVFLYPEAWKGPVAIWIDGRGKAGLYDEKGLPIPPVKRLVEEGVSVASVDLFNTGEFRSLWSDVHEWRKVANPRESISYTLGYNHPLFAQRVHDVLSVIAFVKNHELEPSKVSLIGVNGAGPIVAAAAARVPGMVDKVAVDTEGFRFGSVTEWRDANLWPGAVRYGDLPAVLSLCAPTPLWLAGEKSVPDVVAKTYAAAGKPRSIEHFAGPAKETSHAAAEWVIG